jgi:uncharacterized protein (DUF1778 family)
MSRISIDVTDAQHQRLKALAALQGKSIKEFVLERTLGSSDPASDEAAAMAELEELLRKRVEHFKAGGVSKRTVHEIFEQVIAEAEHRSNE